MQQAWKAALAVVDRLEHNGFEAVIVGGAVRDFVMQRPFHDVDVATEALPLQVKQLFTKTIDVGIEHGTVLVLDCEEPIEVTTYRTESGYSDYRRPDTVTFVRSLKDDLERRDFTMNAIAMRADGALVDYFGGHEDIEAKMIRAVGEPSARFTEDALRMLRAARFRAQLGFQIEAETFAALQEKSALIEHIAVERIAQELTKIFTSDHPALGIEAIRTSRLARHLAGTFDEAPWHALKIQNAEQGWAYFYCLHAEQIPDILSAYKCSNKLKTYAAKVYELVQLNAWDEVTYFDYELEHLLFASYVQSAFGKAAEDEAVILKHKENLRLGSIQELTVSGKDLAEWTVGKKGPWIKERLDILKRAVLTGEVANDRTHIKEWYDAKFNER